MISLAIALAVGAVESLASVRCVQAIARKDASAHAAPPRSPRARDVYRLGTLLACGSKQRAIEASSPRPPR